MATGAETHRPTRPAPDRAAGGGPGKQGTAAAQPALFDTLTYEVGERQAAILERARAARVNLRVVDDRRLALSLRRNL